MAGLSISEEGSFAEAHIGLLEHYTQSSGSADNGSSGGVEQTRVPGIGNGLRLHRGVDVNLRQRFRHHEFGPLGDVDGLRQHDLASLHADPCAPFDQRG